MVEKQPTKARGGDWFRVEQGKLLRSARLAAKLTQVQLEQVSGVGQTHLSAAEHGRTSLSAQNLEKVAAALKITADALMPKGTPGEPPRVLPDGRPLPSTQPKLSTPEEVERIDFADRTPGKPWVEAFLYDVGQGMNANPGLPEFLEQHAGSWRLTLVMVQALAAHRTRWPTGMKPRSDDAYWWEVVEEYEKHFKEALDARAPRADQPKSASRKK